MILRKFTQNNIKKPEQRNDSSKYEWKFTKEVEIINERGKSVKPVGTTKLASVPMVGIVEEKDKGIKNLFDKIFNCVPNLPREWTF